MIVETYQLSFRVFICAFHLESSLIFGKSNPLFIPIFGLSVPQYFSFPCGLFLLHLFLIEKCVYI